jgi:hypothetical protein
MLFAQTKYGGKYHILAPFYNIQTECGHKVYAIILEEDVPADARICKFCRMIRMKGRIDELTSAEFVIPKLNGGQDNKRSLAA